MCNARKCIELEIKREEVRKEMLVRSAEVTEAFNSGDYELCDSYKALLDALVKLNEVIMKEIALVSAEMGK